MDTIRRYVWVLVVLASVASPNPALAADESQRGRRGPARSTRPPVVASVATDANGKPMARPDVRHWAWAALMRRAFDIDVLACPRCGGRLRSVATVEAPDVIQAIQAALFESRELAGRAPPCAGSPD